MTLFHGLSAFPITPATPDGQIIADDLARMLLRLRSARVDSVGLLGSTGTYAYLYRSALRDAVSIAAETLAGDVPLIVSVGALRTDAAVALAQAALAGDAALTAKLNADFDALWALFRAHGGLRVAYGIAHMLGLTKALPPRPILPMPDSATPDLRAALAELDVAQA